MIYWDHSELKKYPSWSLKENKLSKVKKKTMFLFHQNQSIHVPLISFQLKNSVNYIWKSGFLVPLTILKVKKLIHDTLCWLEVISRSLSSLQCLENVWQFSYSCLCFPGTHFLLDLMSYSTGTEDQKYILQVHCVLNLVGSCFVMCT